MRLPYVERTENLPFRRVAFDQGQSGRLPSDTLCDHVLGHAHCLMSMQAFMGRMLEQGVSGSPATPRLDLLRKPTMSYVFARSVVALEPLRREISREPNPSIPDPATIQQAN